MKNSEKTENRRERLRQWFADRPIPEKEKSYLSQLINGVGSFGEKAAARLENTYSMGIGYLDTPANENVSSAPNVRDYVPLISLVQAGNFCEAMDQLYVGDSYEQIPTSYPKKRHTFALEVSGESMLPDFPPGMRLVVEPEMEYQSGDFVIAKNGGDATFKQIVKDGGVWYLKPMNKQFPTLPLAESRVIGVVREAVRKFR